jgi:broad specificity phosphatase PhoE
MISTSDGEVYEDEVAHAFGHKDDSIQAKNQAGTMNVGSPTPEETQIAPNLSQPKKLYIIRHGATAMNAENNTSADRIRGWSDVPLTDEGRQQAHEAGDKLTGMEPPTVLHHSDLDRASETAQIISDKIGVEGTPSRKLRPWDLGVLTGKATKEAIPEIKKYVNDPDTPVPKGESFNEFKSRAFEGIHDALDSGDSPVAIVTHHRLERLLEAWDAKGQPADHDIDLDVFTQKGDPPGGIKEMMVHQASRPEDTVTKTIKATIQHFRNSFMEGPNLLRDFMEGKASATDPEAIKKALSVAWKGTPIRKMLDLGEKVDWDSPSLTEDVKYIDFLTKLKANMDFLDDVEPSKNIEDRRSAMTEEQLLAHGMRRLKQMPISGKMPP